METRRIAVGRVVQAPVKAILRLGIIFLSVSAGTYTPITFGQILQTLHYFQFSDGSWPKAVLVQADDGTLFGTTHYGGAGAEKSFQGGGTVFKVTTNGLFNTLFDFGAGPNGQLPRAGLVRGNDDNFYGTTWKLASTAAESTVFKVAPDGTFAPLAVLDPTNGYFVDAALIRGTDGNFYGTASSGPYPSSGTIFKMTTNGIFTTLFVFDGTNGASPSSRLLQPQNGFLYGVTFLGGIRNSGSGLASLGTLFRLNTNGGEFKTLLLFNRTNGANPSAGLLQASDGNLYGSTFQGGVSNLGTIFQLTPDGKSTVLLSLVGTNGANPGGELIQGKDGSFYGITSRGGEKNLGTVFGLRQMAR